MAILQLLQVNYLNNDYNHTIDFENIDAQTEYFDNLVSMSVDLPTTDDYVYIREHRNISIDANKSDLDGINYLRFKNKDKWWYAFIVSKDYINENMTNLTIEIDVMQTFMFDYNLKESFITREHQDRYKYEDYIDKNNEEVTHVVPQYNLEPEDLEMGTEYEKEYTNKLKQVGDPENLLWLQYITTEPMTKESAFDANDKSSWWFYTKTLNQFGVNSQIYVYLLPFINKPTGAVTGNFYTYDAQGNIIPITNFGGIIRKSPEVISKRILDYCPVKYSISSYNTTDYLITFEGGFTSTAANNTLSSPVFPVYPFNENFNFSEIFTPGSVTALSLVSVNTTSNNDIGRVYNPHIVGVDLDPNLSINNLKNSQYETKLKSYPYSYIQLTDYKSNPLVVKPELLKFYDGIDFGNVVKYIQSIGIQNKTKIYVEDYNINDKGKEFNTINNTIDELPILNSAYLDYMSRNKASATTGFAINTGLNFLTGSIRTVVGLSGKNPFAISNAISDIGGLANSISSHLHKMQDLKNTPDSVRESGNNAEFDIMDRNYQIVFSRFVLKLEFFKKLFNYFYRYGYACNNFKLPDIRSRYYFNYIQSPDMCIDSGIDNEYINKIKQIYRDGITIWHYRDENTFKGVENYDYENVEMTFIS